MKFRKPEHYKIINTIKAWLLATTTMFTPTAGFAQSVSQYEYDAHGRLIATQDGLRAKGGYEHDRADNRLKVQTSLQFPSAWPATSPAIGHIVGRQEADGWSARVEDPQGHMIFGPYTSSVAQGGRVAAYRMLVDNNDANNSAVVDLDVWDATTGTQLASRRVSRMEWKVAGYYQVFELPFDVPADRVGHAFEFRIFYLRSSYVRVEKVGYR